MSKEQNPSMEQFRAANGPFYFGGIVAVASTLGSAPANELMQTIREYVHAYDAMLAKQ
jgi:hypothetical protein